MDPCKEREKISEKISDLGGIPAHDLWNRSPVWVFLSNPFSDTLRQSLKRFFCSSCERFSLQVQQRTVFRGANTFSIAFAEGIRQHDCEHHAEQCAGKDTTLLDTVGDRECIGSRILPYLILRRACHRGINDHSDKFVRAVKLAHNLL